MSGVSAVVLNWKRPANVHLILDSWRASGLIDQAIVWNNNPDTDFRHDWATVVNASPDLGLYTRFAAVALAAHPTVLVQDDDVHLPSSTISALLDAWTAQPRILHGLFGRGPRNDGSYARDLEGDQPAPIILTRALVTQRRHAARFFHAAPLFEHLQTGSTPQGNGEDIIFSYAVRHWTRRLHRVHALAREELPAADAIHQRDWGAHVAHRTRLMQAGEAWLAASPTTPTTPTMAPPQQPWWGRRLSGLRRPGSPASAQGGRARPR